MIRIHYIVRNHFGTLFACRYLKVISKTLFTPFSFQCEKHLMKTRTLSFRGQITAAATA